MTESPRTAAGRAMLIALGRRSWSREAFRQSILAIEAEAADAHDHDPDRCDECQAMVMEALRE